MDVLAIIFWVAWGMVFYTYVGYPILLAVIARIGGKEPKPVELPPDEALPKVAMVVAAYNEAGVIADKLINTWQIDYPADRFTIYIGSDGSADGTNEILEACDDPRLKAYCFTERRGKISVLNDLFQRVDADIVVMSDANTMFAHDAVKKLVAHFSDPQVGCVSGELALEQDGGVSGEGLYWKYEGWMKRNESRMGFLIGCNGGIFAIRPELFEPLPASTIVEDFVISMRILERGHKVIFEPAARATEPPCPSSKAEMIRKVRIGAGGFQALGLTRNLLSPRFGFRAFGFWGHKVLRWFAPLFLSLALLANVGLVQSDFYLTLIVLQASGMLVASWTYQLRPGQNVPRWVRPVSYFYLMNYALFCGFLRFMFRTQRVTWERASR